MSRCPNCNRDITDRNGVKVYRWEKTEATLCASCDRPRERQAAAPTLTAEDVIEATQRVVQYEWKQEGWRIYLELGGTPGCIKFPTNAIYRASNGNTNPLEWRLEQEFERNVDLSDAGEELAELWFADPEHHETAGGKVVRQEGADV
jgi:hypothetical protein